MERGQRKVRTGHGKNKLTGTASCLKFTQVSQITTRMPPPEPKSVPFASTDVRRGFTLLELLAVIAMIALLFSLAIPAVNGALGKSRAIKAMSNMRQVTGGIMLYSAENDGFLPPLYGSMASGWNVPFWTQRVDPYVYSGGSGVTNSVASGLPLVGAAFYCPSVKRHHSIGDWGLNSNIAPHAAGGPNKRVRLAKIERRSATALLFEAKNPNGTTDGSWYLNVPLASSGTSRDWFGDWHNGKPFVSFCDGSVQFFTYETLLDTWKNMVGTDLGPQSEPYVP